MKLARILFLVFLGIFILGTIFMVALTLFSPPENTPVMKSLVFLTLGLIAYVLSFAGIFHHHVRFTLMGGALLALVSLLRINEISPMAFLIPVSILNYGMILRNKLRAALPSA